MLRPAQTFSQSRLIPPSRRSGRQAASAAYIFCTPITLAAADISATPATRSSAQRAACISEKKLVSDCLKQGRAHGFRILQFNAVVASNTHARHLYERLGFHPLGVIPGGFRMKDGHYEDICPYYHVCKRTACAANAAAQAVRLSSGRFSGRGEEPQIIRQRDAA